VPNQKRDPRKDPRAALGEALRQLRIDCGLTQAAAAAQIDGYGEDSLSKAETGGQVPTDDLYARLLALYQVTGREKALLDVLLDSARNAEPVIPEFAEPWLKVEPEAALIRAWALDVMPGLLQTFEYAKAMFMMRGLDEDTAAARADARIKRRAIIDAPEGTRLTAILYEPLLNRLVGTPEIMAEELGHLLAMSRLPNVVIQVVREAGYFAGCEGQFEIASGRTIPDTLNMITVEDQTTAAPAVVDRVIGLFEEIRGYALPIEESRSLIQEALQRWKSQQ
jgi:transcriptional regulator with XRE-family HTH domain